MARVFGGFGGTGINNDDNMKGNSNGDTGSPRKQDGRNGNNNNNNDNTVHYHFIHSMLLPSTVKIQKELRGRKFKEVQAKLGEIVISLHAFQFEEWPPHDGTIDLSAATTTTTAVESTKATTTTISWDEHLRKEEYHYQQRKDADTKNHNGRPLSDESERSDIGDTESVVGDFAPNSSMVLADEEGLKPFDDCSAATATTASASTTGSAGTTATTTTTTTIPLSSKIILMEDDPRTRFEMHQSVKDALEAYIMVMEHPHRTNTACEAALSCVKQLVVRDYVIGRPRNRDDAMSPKTAAVSSSEQGGGPPSTTTAGPATNGTPVKEPLTPLQLLIMGIQKCGESKLDSMQNQVIETLKEIVTNTFCNIHDTSMLFVVRTIFHIFLVTKSQAVKTSAKAALVDMVSNIVLMMEEIQSRQQVTTSPFHIDSFYLLRSLVKLSSKELPGIDDSSTTPTNFLAQQFFTVSAADPVALNNKVLSLELILTAMECAGDALCNGERFVHLVQAQLCVALLKNCMSNNSQVSYISQRIFLVLVSKFKAHLREEIQLFMANIFLRVLESDSSSFIQKALVLESLRSLCNDPQLLTQIFLNYDCDFDSVNLYKDIVFHLTKLCAKATATSTSNMNKKDAEEHSELSLASVEVLVTILGAFVKALGMEITDSETNDAAGRKIRAMLKLQEIGSQRTSTLLKMRVTGDAPSNTVATRAKSVAELGLSAEDLERLEEDEHPSLPHVESSSDVAERIVDVFDRKRNAEQNFEMGAVKFTLNFKTGLNFFFENNFLTLDAKEIAHFFLDNKDKLDKTQMGEVLGREPDASFVKNADLEADKGGPGFFIRILHYYIEAQDFSGLLFDDAIRLFLSGFRLPGEAQKIDRIMEKFAERFTRQNPNIFPSADTAFILAFSVIMLNTDLHNPSIKPERRMTVESFLRNNRGIGENGSDLPEEFLRGIFERIKKSPFSLKEDDAAREKALTDIQDSYFVGEGGLLGFGLVGPPTTAERKKEQFKKERDEMLLATEELIRRRRRKLNTSGRSTTMNVAPADVAKPMFDVTWGPVLGIFSQVIEMAIDARCVSVCFNGFVYAIRLASHSQMSLARETFINSLTKFTLLGSIKEMKSKNMEAIHTLMKIAASDGEYLGESWGPVLQCISQLAKMRTAASGLKSDESFLEEASSAKSPKQTASKSYFAGASATSKAEDTAKETELSNQKAVLEAVSEQTIDQVFSSTVKLSAQSLADFMRQLVSVSTIEIAGDARKSITGVASSVTRSSHGPEDGPSIFSLQRLVEVADYNMDVRPRLVWAQIWEILGQFFAKAGCNRNSMVSVFAIDSLKQLSSKFLEKPELAEFHFQRMFLRPFLTILQNPETRQDIRELILECVSQLVDRKAYNLQSGWKIFFDIIMVSAASDNVKITLRALSMLQKMLDEHLEKLTRLAMVDPELKDHSQLSVVEKRNRNSNAEDFIGMCRASLSFVRGNGDEASPIPLGASMRALCHMAIYSDLVADGRILPPVSGAQSTDPSAFGFTYENLEEQEALEMALWRPILEGLADGIRSPARGRTDGIGCMIQRGSMLAMRAILLRHGALFSSNQLLAILQQTVVPTIQQASDGDYSAVVKITSESPTITGLDFLAAPLPLPPPRYDRGLLKFEEVARSVERAPSRPLGPAELLLEASMTDMRHGGDGDLRQAYKFAKKDMSKNSDGEQPFPDSWIATTGPIAFGCLTDVASEIILVRGSEGATVLWPVIGHIFRRWCNGDCCQDENGQHGIGSWTPCEALVRIATREILRFSSRLAARLPQMASKDAKVWVNTFVPFFVETLTQSLDIEKGIEEDLLQQKIQAYHQSKLDQESVGPVTLLSVDRKVPENGEDKATDVVATPRSSPRNSNSVGWVKLVPVLKIRCIAVCFLQHCVAPLKEVGILSHLTQDNASILLETLNRSRINADLAVQSEDLAHAFQEALLSEWGDDDDETGEEALVNIARLSQTQGSAMFYLTQNSGATQAAIWWLGAHFEFKGQEKEEEKVEQSGDDIRVIEWEREQFAAPYLIEIITDVLTRFVESETKEGKKIDPNVWRSAAESGTKVAVYCTSFASVVVELLKVIHSYEVRHMKAHGSLLFPMICRLIQVQSDEIRILVQSILIEKFGPILNELTSTDSSLGVD